MGGKANPTQQADRTCETSVSRSEGGAGQAGRSQPVPFRSGQDTGKKTARDGLPGK